MALQAMHLLMVRRPMGERVEWPLRSKTCKLWRSCHSAQETTRTRSEQISTISSKLSLVMTKDTLPARNFKLESLNKVLRIILTISPTQISNLVASKSPQSIPSLKRSRETKSWTILYFLPFRMTMEPKNKHLIWTTMRLKMKMKETLRLKLPISTSLLSRWHSSQRSYWLRIIWVRIVPIKWKIKKTNSCWYSKMIRRDQTSKT